MAQACLLLSQATPEWSGGIQWNWRNIYLPLSQKMFVLMSTWFLSSWRKRQSGSMAPNYSVTFGNASDSGTLQAPLFGLVCHQMWEGTTPCGQLIILTELKQVAVTSCTSPNSYLLYFFPFLTCLSASSLNDDIYISCSSALALVPNTAPSVLYFVFFIYCIFMFDNPNATTQWQCRPQIKTKEINNGNE